MPDPSLEIAVFKVTEADGFDATQRSVHQQLSTFPGYLESLPLRGRDDAAQRVDLVLWESADAAAEASETVRQDPRFAPFMSAIASVDHFHHYAGATPDALAGLAEGAFVEVAAYAASEATTALQSRAHDALALADGAGARIAGVGAGPERADIIGWTSPEAFSAAPKALVAHDPGLSAFFEGVDTMHVFLLFEPVR